MFPNSETDAGSEVDGYEDGVEDQDSGRGPFHAAAQPKMAVISSRHLTQTFNVRPFLMTQWWAVRLQPSIWQVMLLPI